MVKLFKKILLLFCSTLILGSCGEVDSGSNQKDPTNYQITFSEVAVSITVGESYKLNATAEPNNRIIFYEVRDPDIASITTTGVVTGLKVGETVCYASVGNAKAICNLSVKAEPLENSLSISLENDDYTIAVGDDFIIPLEVHYGANLVTDYLLEADIETSGVVEFSNNKVTGISIGETNMLLKVSYNEKTTAKLIHITVI